MVGISCAKTDENGMLFIILYDLLHRGYYILMKQVEIKSNEL